MAWQTPKTNWKTGDIPLAGDFNRIEQNIQELENTKETPAGAQAKVDTHAASKQTHGISGGYYIAKTSRSDQLPAWGDIQGKPSTYPPAAHTHSGSDITSAVANASNADMLDGVHASDFSRIISGTYTGNGASSRVISLPFTPKLAFITGLNDLSSAILIYNGSGNFFYGLGDSYASHSNQPAGYSPSVQIVTNGIQVAKASPPRFNMTGVTYGYVALG